MSEISLVRTLSVTYARCRSGAIDVDALGFTEGHPTVEDTARPHVHEGSVLYIAGVVDNACTYCTRHTALSQPLSTCVSEVSLTKHQEYWNVAAVIQRVRNTFDVMHVCGPLSAPVTQYVLPCPEAINSVDSTTLRHSIKFSGRRPRTGPSS